MCDDDRPPFQGVFERVARNRLGSLSRRLDGDANEILEQVHESVTRELVDGLAGASSQVLYHDFATFRARTRGDASPGGPPSDAPARGLFDGWMRALESDGLGRLRRDYRELDRLLDDVVASWETRTEELIGRLVGDRGVLARAYASTRPMGRVSSIAPGLSDPHGGGRTVCAVEFSSGLRVIYKPRDVAIEGWFSGLVAWLNRRGLDPPLRAARVLRRDGYGWAESMSAIPCPDEGSARLFYRRAGILACVLDVLGATDIHYGNLVAAGEHPVLVDLETLFHPGSAVAGDRLEDTPGSVLRTGFVPYWTPASDHRSYDVSGLGSVSPRTTEVRRLVWRDPDTDEMMPVESGIPIPRLANVPTLRGEPLSPVDFVPDIQAGFEAAYRLLARHGDDLVAPGGLLHGAAHLRTRVLLRHTVTYRHWIERSLDPACLRTPEARRSALAERSSTPPGRRLDGLAADARSRAELDALLRLDIPHFSSAVGPAGLEEAGGSGRSDRIPGWTREPPARSVARRLARMNDDDLATRTGVLRTVLQLAELEASMRSA